MNGENYKRSLRMGVNNVTNWDPASEIVQSQWGPIPYRNWCEREAARWNRTGKPARVVENEFGRCCVAV